MRFADVLQNLAHARLNNNTRGITTLSTLISVLKNEIYTSSDSISIYIYICISMYLYRYYLRYAVPRCCCRSAGEITPATNCCKVSYIDQRSVGCNNARRSALAATSQRQIQEDSCRYDSSRVPYHDDLTGLLASDKPVSCSTSLHPVTQVISPPALSFAHISERAYIAPLIDVKSTCTLCCAHVGTGLNCPFETPSR